MNKELILVLDFNPTLAQMAARQVRAAKVYCEVLPGSTSIQTILDAAPKGIVIAGGEGEAPPLSAGLFELGLPVLGVHEGASIASRDGLLVTATETGHTDHYSMKFTPSHLQTEKGKEALETFLYRTCKCLGGWTTDVYIEEEIKKLRAELGGRVLLGLSGGVDSSVTAMMLHKAIGDKLVCVFVDHGLLRKGEADEVVNLFKKKMGMSLVHVDASERFLEKLKGVRNPERKRMIIGEEFIRVFEDEAKKLGKIEYLAQGTIYPDLLESGVGAKFVKSHHNVGGLPENIGFKGIVEPLRLLFKDEVRVVGEALGLSHEMVWRQPFPGPGIGVRCVGVITRDKLRALRDADAIFREEIKKASLSESIWQYFAANLGVKSVGMKNGARNFGYTIALRAVHTTDAMNASVAQLDYALLTQSAERIINEVDGIGRVVYDVTPKPPGTIEFE